MFCWIIAFCYLVIVAMILLFFKRATMKGNKYDEDIVLLKNEKLESGEGYEYKKYLNDYLIEVRNKNQIEDFKSLGFVKYVSTYTNLIGMECSGLVAKLLEEHPNVISIEEAETGHFLVDETMMEEQVEPHEFEV